MKRIQIMAVCFIILLSPFLILLNIESFHNYLFQKNNVEINDQIQKASDEMIAYLSHRINYIESYDEYENNHMKDARFYFDIVTLLFIVSIILFSINFNKKRCIKIIKRGSILVLCLGLILTIFSFLDFNSLFWGFHKIFFKEGTYTFDPNTSLMKFMYPDKFFMDFLTISLGISICIALLVLIGLYYYEKRRR